MHFFCKLILRSICVSVFTAGLPALTAQQTVWQPSPGHIQIPIWPGAAPDARMASGPEHTETVSDPKEFVACKPWLTIKDVSRPTLTVYSPKGRNTGVAVVVFPGGGYQELAIDLEGTEACDWLTNNGVTSLGRGDCEARSRAEKIAARVEELGHGIFDPPPASSADTPTSALFRSKELPVEETPAEHQLRRLERQAGVLERSALALAQQST